MPSLTRRVVDAWNVIRGYAAAQDLRSSAA